MKLLIEDDQLLKKYLNLSHVQWSEIHYSAISCLEGILMSYNSTFVAKELIYIIKDITLDIVSSSLYLNDNKYYHTKVSNKYGIKLNCVVFIIIIGKLNF